MTFPPAPLSRFFFGSDCFELYCLGPAPDAVHLTRFFARLLGSHVTVFHFGSWPYKRQDCLSSIVSRKKTTGKLSRSRKKLTKTTKDMHLICITLIKFKLFFSDVNQSIANSISTFFWSTSFRLMIIPWIHPSPQKNPPVSIRRLPRCNDRWHEV